MDLLDIVSQWFRSHSLWYENKKLAYLGREFIDNASFALNKFMSQVLNFDMMFYPHQKIKVCFAHIVQSQILITEYFCH